MQVLDQAENFWADTYRGRTIAILNHGGGWLVYLDHVLQPRMMFATAEAAVAGCAVKSIGRSEPTLFIDACG